MKRESGTISSVGLLDRAPFVSVRGVDGMLGYLKPASIRKGGAEVSQAVKIIPSVAERDHPGQFEAINEYFEKQSVV